MSYRLPYNSVKIYCHPTLLRLLPKAKNIDVLLDDKGKLHVSTIHFERDEESLPLSGTFRLSKEETDNSFNFIPSSENYSLGENSSYRAGI